MKRTTALGLAIFFAAAGCATSEVQERWEASTRIVPDEAVTIILTAKFLAGWGIGLRGGDEEGIARCVGRAMRTVSPMLRLIPPGEFRASLFPWFERATAPDSLVELASLLNKPLIQEQIATLGIRYVIAVTGDTTKGQDKGGILPSYSGLIGYKWWDRQSQLSATVWDLKATRSLGTVEVSASGRDSLLAFILPIYIGAPTERTACRDLGQQLARYLTGGVSE